MLSFNQKRKRKMELVLVFYFDEFFFINISLIEQLRKLNRCLLQRIDI